MIVPNKLIALSDSVLSKLPTLLGEGPAPIDILTLYDAVRQDVESIDQFLLAIDVLYILGRIDVDPATRAVTYAG